MIVLSAGAGPDKARPASQHIPDHGETVSVEGGLTAVGARAAGLSV